MIISTEYQYPGIIKIFPPPFESEGKALAEKVLTFHDDEIEAQYWEGKFDDVNDLAAKLKKRIAATNSLLNSMRRQPLNDQNFYKLIDALHGL